MNKCFLLLLIIVYILYNCKPLIEPFDEYDTSQDDIQEYQETEGVEQSYYSYIYGLVAGDQGPTDDDADWTSRCTSYADIDSCGQFASAAAAGNDYEWEYNGANPEWIRTTNGGEPSNKNRDKCATCFECEDGKMFVKSYYGWFCDALAGGCGDGTPIEPDLVPFHYTHHSVEWDDDCVSTPELPLNAKQIATCNSLDNMVTNSFKIFTKPESAGCSIDILESQIRDEAMMFG